MAEGLVVLLTNIWLESRAGSETVTRDLAIGLLRRGHRPIVYSPKIGEAAHDIVARGVSIIDDLRQMGETPDLIHAHHSVPCGEALIRFPHVPALYTCHAFDFWVEAPVHFPQIAVYAAVDEACRDRLVHTEGIHPERVVMLPNAVDLTRIPARRAELPDRPLRAAAFGKAAIVPDIALACARAGVEYSALGWPAAASLADPEQELINFDIVFASARAATEALCCGCAVIVCDRRGFAGLVTTQNFDALRARNFGLRSLGEPLTLQRFLDEIGRYDATDAAAVTQLARDAADLEKHLDRIESLYAEILTGPRRPAISSDAHERAVARFLHENLPRTPNDPRWPWLGARDDMEGQIAELSKHWVAMDQECITLRLERSAQADRVATLEVQLANVRQELEVAKVANRDIAHQLAGLNRSRLLRLGRWLRRLAGQGTPRAGR
jgi:hypothetical protein